MTKRPCEEIAGTVPFGIYLRVMADEQRHLREQHRGTAW
jgi:hypothetical protein